jgi:hypothetical protein
MEVLIRPEYREAFKKSTNKLNSNQKNIINYIYRNLIIGNLEKEKNFKIFEDLKIESELFHKETNLNYNSNIYIEIIKDFQKLISDTLLLCYKGQLKDKKIHLLDRVVYDTDGFYIFEVNWILSEIIFTKQLEDYMNKKGNFKYKNTLEYYCKYNNIMEHCCEINIEDSIFKFV